MPGENIQAWSISAIDNGNSDTLINWAEHQPRASVNNSARSMMAAHAKQRNLLNGSIITTGSANAQNFTSGVAYTAIPTGLRALLKMGFSNTDFTTLNMDGIGAVAVKNIYGANLAGGELVANGLFEFIYDGTNWIAIGVGAGALALVSAQTAVNASAVDFSNLFTVGYKHYVFELLYNLSNDGSKLVCIISTDNGTSYIQAGYYWASLYAALDAPTGTMSAAANKTYMQVGPVIPVGGSPQATIMDLTVTGEMYFRSFGYSAPTGTYMFSGSNTPPNSVFNHVRFYASGGGTLYGTFKMYGVRQ